MGNGQSDEGGVGEMEQTNAAGRTRHSLRQNSYVSQSESSANGESLATAALAGGAVGGTKRKAPHCKASNADYEAPTASTSSCQSTTSSSSFGKRKRLALLIGNSNYTGEIPVLKNPKNDATALAAKLQRDCGFEVDLKLDLGTLQDMEEAVDAFCDRLAQNAGGLGVAGFIFFAGHAVQVEGQNFLLPVKMPPIRKRLDLKYHALPLDFLLERLDLAGNHLNIVVLDCCREDPFQEKEATRGISRKGGLAPVTNARGIIIAYSCSPNSYARDSPDRSNSVYTHHLIRNIAEKVSIDTVFRKVISGVQRDTNNEQTPWILSCMTEEIKLRDVEELATQAAVFPTFDDDGADPTRDLTSDVWGVLFSHNAKYSNFFIEKDEVLIGRQESCHVQISDSTCISRVHCRVFRGDKDEPVLEDASANGTWVDKKLVGQGKRIVLSDGDEITIQKPNRKAGICKLGYTFRTPESAQRLLRCESSQDTHHAGSPSKKHKSNGGSKASRTSSESMTTRSSTRR